MKVTELMREQLQDIKMASNTLEGGKAALPALGKIIGRKENQILSGQSLNFMDLMFTL